MVCLHVSGTSSRSGEKAMAERRGARAEARNLSRGAVAAGFPRARATRSELRAYRLLESRLQSGHQAVKLRSLRERGLSLPSSSKEIQVEAIHLVSVIRALYLKIDTQNSG